VSAGAGYSKDSQVDRDIDVTGLLLGTATRRRQHYAGSAESILSEKTIGTLSYSYGKETFDNTSSSDSTIQDMTLTLNHDLDSLLPLTTGRITTGCTFTEYSQTDITEYPIMAGATKKLTETVEISADIGTQQMRTRDKSSGISTETTHSHGTIGQAALTYRGEFSTAGLSYVRDVHPVSGQMNITNYSSVQLNLDRRFSYKLRGGLTTVYSQNKQEKNEAFSSPLDQNTLRVQPRLSYNFTNDIWAEASYIYTRIRDKANDQITAQNLYYLILNWQYPIPN
jgi:hypothetical protein